MSGVECPDGKWLLCVSSQPLCERPSFCALSAICSPVKEARVLEALSDATGSNAEPRPHLKREVAGVLASSRTEEREGEIRGTATNATDNTGNHQMRSHFLCCVGQ